VTGDGDQDADEEGVVDDEDDDFFDGAKRPF